MNHLDLTKLVALTRTNPALYEGELGDQMLAMFQSSQARHLARLLMGKPEEAMQGDEDQLEALRVLAGHCGKRRAERRKTGKEPSKDRQPTHPK